MRISLEEMTTVDICSLGEKVRQKYDDNDISYIRATSCENSYLTTNTEKGEEILLELKKEYNF